MLTYFSSSYEYTFYYTFCWIKLTVHSVISLPMRAHNTGNYGNIITWLMFIVLGTSWWLWPCEARHCYIWFIGPRVSSAVCIALCWYFWFFIDSKIIDKLRKYCYKFRHIYRSCIYMTMIIIILSVVLPVYVHVSIHLCPYPEHY